MLDKDSIKTQLGIEQVVNFLSDLGVSGEWLEEGKVAFETCCHNRIGEGSHKMYYYDNTKLFYCYTGCGRFDIFELLSKMNLIEKNEELSLDDAITLFSQSQSFLSFAESEDKREPELEREYVKPNLKPFDKTDLASMPRAIVHDWLNEGISFQTQRRYNIRFNFSLNSILIPHLDADFNLLSVKQRLLDETMIEELGKYRPLFYRGVNYAAPSSFYLYGLTYNKDNIRREKKAIVLEGEKSVMKVDDLLSPKDNIMVASFGMQFSRHHYEELKKFGVEEIIFGFDRQFKELYDQEFSQLLRTMHTINTRFKDNKEGIKLTFMFDHNKITSYKDSPVDNGLEEFTTLYRERKTYEEIAEMFFPHSDSLDLHCLEESGEDGEIYAY